MVLELILLNMKFMLVPVHMLGNRHRLVLPLTHRAPVHMLIKLKQSRLILLIIVVDTPPQQPLQSHYLPLHLL